MTVDTLKHTCRSEVTSSAMGRSCIRFEPIKRRFPSPTHRTAVRGRIAVPALPIEWTSYTFEQNITPKCNVMFSDVPSGTPLLFIVTISPWQDTLTPNCFSVCSIISVSSLSRILWIVVVPLDNALRSNKRLLRLLLPGNCTYRHYSYT